MLTRLTFFSTSFALLLGCSSSSDNTNFTPQPSNDSGADSNSDVGAEATPVEAGDAATDRLEAAGEDSNAAVEAGQEAGLDAPSLDSDAPTDSPSSCARAIVVSLNRDEGDDSVKIYSLSCEGVVTDPNLEFTGFDNPRHVAVRPDGKEALVAFGRFGGDYGVAVVSLQPEGSAAKLEQILVAGKDMLPSALSYMSNDHAVLAMAAGSDGHTYIALDRGSDNKLALGKTSLVKDNWPEQLLRHPGSDDGLLLRVDLLSSGSPSEIRLIRQGTEGWDTVGTSGFVNPHSIYFAAHASGKRVFSPTGDPKDPGSKTNLDPKGLLHVYRVEAGGLVQEPDYALTRYASMITADPNGQFIVTEVPVLQADPNSESPTVRSYKFQTVTLDADGNPTGVSVSSDPAFPAGLFHGLELSSQGYLVGAAVLFADQAPTPDDIYPLVIWKQATPGDWKPVGDPLYLPGLPAFAVAP